jgi:iron(III) transport system permease protein
MTFRSGSAPPIRSLHLRPRSETICAIVLLALVALLVVAPLAAVLSGGLREGGAFGLRALSAVFASTRIIGNTLTVGVATTFLGLAIGAVLALIVARIDTPGRGLLEQLIVLPLYITPLLTAIAWSWLGSPRGGIINKAAQAIGLPPLVDLHSAAGVVFVASLAYAPIAFLLIGGALRAMDPALEDCARVHGATAPVSLLRITLPLVLPAALGAALLILVQTIGLFSVPAVLGMPANFYVVGTEIYRLLNNYPPRLGQAGAWALLLLVAAAALVSLQTVILGRFSHVTVSGKAFRARLLEPGRWGPALAAVAWVYVVLAVILPVLTLAWASLVNFITIDPHLMAFDLRHFHYVLFDYPKTFLAAGNSLVLAIFSAALILALALPIAWIALRGRNFIAPLLDQLATVPLAIPPMVLALGLLWTYVGASWFPIYNTLVILLVAYVTHYLPVGLRSLAGALRQIHPELEDAARVAGGGFLTTLRLIVVPLVRPTLAATSALLFILCLQEVSSSILLYTSRTTVLSVAVFDLWEAGNVNALAALGILQILVTFAILLMISRWRLREVAG